MIALSLRKFMMSVFGCVMVSLFVATAVAQQQNNIVPTLVSFSGTLTDVNGKPVSGTVGVTFSLFKDQQGGSPLWMETQNVQSDKSGRYTVMLGSTKSQGLPTGLFASGEARWLGVQPQNQAEQPRVLLLSVPYALKAGDAQTIGGLPPTAFVLAAPAASSGVAGADGTDANAPASGVTGSGTVNFLPIWTGTSTIGNSVLFQTGSGKTAKVGINTATPSSTLDVKGGGTIRGLLNLPAAGTATAIKGFDSQPEALVTSVFNSGTSTAVPQTFQWQAEPVGNNTNGATGSLNLLFGKGSGKPSETGLNIASSGQIKFASGQTFPGTGTVTSVGSGAGLAGGPITGSGNLSIATAGVTNAMLVHPSLTVTAGTDLTGGGSVALGGTTMLNLDTTKVPQLKSANTFTANQAINGNLSATGSITGQTGNFSANNTTQVLNVTQSGSANGINASATSSGTAVVANGGVGVFARASGLAGGSGLLGYGLADLGYGVAGDATGVSGIGTAGYASGSQGLGAFGQWSNPSTIGYGTGDAGVWGDSANGFGVIGSSDTSYGVFGESSSVGVGGLSNADGGDGVYGQSTSSGNGVGVIGVTDGAGAGVQGVLGFSHDSTAIGVYGVTYGSSVTGSGLSNVGVWGDTFANDDFAVVGTADNGNAFFGKNNTVNHETLYLENDSGFSGGNTPLAARFAGPGSSTYCYIARDLNDDGTGDLICTGSKSAAVPVDGNRMVRMYAVEAADNWFEDAGAGQLSNGSVFVNLDRVFAQTVGGDLDYHVFLTPNGECESLYVASKTSRGFEVREMHGGRSNVAFDYRIMAKRKGFEQVRMQDVTADFAQMKKEADLVAARQEAGKAAAKAHPPRMPSPPRLKATPSKANSAANRMPLLPSTAGVGSTTVK